MSELEVRHDRTMTTWRDTILDDFVPNVSKLTLVADPDCLLTEELLALELRKRGFDLIEFDDPVAFRYAYESQYRAIWDRGDSTDLVVALRFPGAELDALPYDLLQKGRRLTLNLGSLFPNLSYPVLDELDRGHLDALFEAQQVLPPEPLGDNATKDFILRCLFRISPDLIASEVDLLQVLLRLHYGRLQIPQVLVVRLVETLSRRGGFVSWPLLAIMEDSEAFFGFLQERWPTFLAEHGNAKEVREGSLAQHRAKSADAFVGDVPSKTMGSDSQYGFKYPGPVHLPFGHRDIMVYIDNLFLEGKLKPVEFAGIGADTKSWVRVGIAVAGREDDVVRVSGLFDLIEKQQPTAESRYTDWTAFSLKWAELAALVHCGDDADHQARLKKISDAVNNTFAEWLQGHYSSLFNMPPSEPVMLHHVPRSMARDVEEAGSRVALLVLDGLALDQWVSIRQILQEQNTALTMREAATYAWIPTMTSVSRQAIFAGKPPAYYPVSINSTHNEEKLWRLFWEGHGLSGLDVAYGRGLGDGDVASALDALIHPDKTRVVGLVVDKVDKIMHGMQLGAAGMHNQIRQWCQGGFLVELVTQLLDYGYEVWLTSDHGNIECEGRGRPSEGVIAEVRGERARVYPTPELRSQVARDFPFAHEWQPVGLPPGCFPLLAGGRDAFVRPGEGIVGHGGIAMEEVIVPLVRFAKRRTYEQET